MMSGSNSRIFHGIVAASAIGCFILSVWAQDEKRKPGAEAKRRVSTGLRAVAHEGCVARGAIWSGKLTPGKRVLVPMFVFKTNDYFLVVAPDRGVPDPKLRCEIRNVVGEMVTSSEIRGKNRLVLAFRPKVSGRSYVSLLLPKESQPVDVSVGYAYQ